MCKTDAQCLWKVGARMRILLINDWYNIVGGAEISFHQNVKLLKEKGHEVFVFAFGDRNITRRDLVVCKQNYKNNLYNLFNRYFNPFIYFRLKRYIWRIRPDLIHIHKNSHSPLSVLMACKGKKIVQTVRDYGVICFSAWGIKKNGKWQHCSPFPPNVLME